MLLTIIDYGSGNLHSIRKAFEVVAGSRTQVKVSADANDIEKADRIVLPGVGAFGDCMNGLKTLPGVLEALQEVVKNKQRPFIGVCVGMQLLAEKGLEHGQHEGLGWIKGEVVPIVPSEVGLKIPHMGWNELEVRETMKKEHQLLRGVSSGDHAYFVHSFRFESTEKDVILAEVEYGGKIAAILAKGNIMATQFHPEKSQKLGLAIIENFLSV